MLNAVQNPESIATLGLASSDFARHYFRNLGWFLFLALLRCFSSGGSPHIPMYSVYDDRTWLLPDCSIRKSADRNMLATPRSLSQLTASFIGSWCQGILPTLLLAWPFELCFLSNDFFPIIAYCSCYPTLKNFFFKSFSSFALLLILLHYSIFKLLMFNSFLS